jgi:hypothetical protein
MPPGTHGNRLKMRASEVLRGILRMLTAFVAQHLVMGLFINSVCIWASRRTHESTH